MPYLSPSGDVTFAGCLCGCQASGLDVFVELDGLCQLEHGDIVVHGARVVTGMLYNSGDAHILFGSLSAVSVVLTNPDGIAARVEASCHAMGGCDDPLVAHEGTSTSGPAVIQHQNLPWPRTTCCGLSSDNARHLDLGFSAAAWWVGSGSFGGWLWWSLCWWLWGRSPTEVASLGTPVRHELSVVWNSTESHGFHVKTVRSLIFTCLGSGREQHYCKNTSGLHLV